MVSLEYIAGFFDGEGSIGIYRNGKGTFHLRTQLTQNCNPTTEDLLSEIQRKFGGNLSTMQSEIYRRNKAFNWQLNGDAAANFLKTIQPFLRLKREQADVAIGWQAQHIPPGRCALGRMLPYTKDSILDVGTSLLLKALKTATMTEVLLAQADLVSIEHTLRQVVCVKG